MVTDQMFEDMLSNCDNKNLLNRINDEFLETLLIAINKMGCALDLSEALELFNYCNDINKEKI